MATRDEIVGFHQGRRGHRRPDRPLASRRQSFRPGNQAFHFVTSFTAAKGEVRLVTSGANTIVQVDGDNDPAIDMTILVHNAHIHAVDLIL